MQNCGCTKAPGCTHSSLWSSAGCWARRRRLWALLFEGGSRNTRGPDLESQTCSCILKRFAPVLKVLGCTVLSTWENSARVYHEITIRDRTPAGATSRCHQPVCVRAWPPGAGACTLRWTSRWRWRVWRCPWRRPAAVTRAPPCPVWQPSAGRWSRSQSLSWTPGTAPRPAAAAGCPTVRLRRTASTRAPAGPGWPRRSRRRWPRRSGARWSPRRSSLSRGCASRGWSGTSEPAKARTTERSSDFSLSCSMYNSNGVVDQCKAYGTGRKISFVVIILHCCSDSSPSSGFHLTFI